MSAEGGLQPRLDHRAVDWPRVRRAVYRVQQRYTYTYTVPISDLRHQLVVIPRPRHGDQRLLDYELEVARLSAGPRIAPEHDPFGNHVHRIFVARVEEAVEFTVGYRVERVVAGDPAVSIVHEPMDLAAHLEPTALTAPDGQLDGVSRELSRDRDPRGTAERIHDWTARAITYQFGVTGYQTPAALALHLGKGVCQDYAHIMLALLRRAGVPARYVSGHLLGEGAPHAWVEALFEAPAGSGRFEAVAYDPTHHRRAGLSYITVAVGRDFADVTPTSGSFTAPREHPVRGHLSYSKRAEIIELQYADEPPLRLPEADHSAA